MKPRSSSRSNNQLSMRVIDDAYCTREREVDDQVCVRIIVKKKKCTYVRTRIKLAAAGSIGIAPTRKGHARMTACTSCRVCLIRPRPRTSGGCFLLFCKGKHVHISFVAVADINILYKRTHTYTHGQRTPLDRSETREGRSS
jgi:hypothetical protein